MTTVLATAHDYQTFFIELDPRIRSVVLDDVQTMPSIGPYAIIIRLGVKWRWYDFRFWRRRKMQAWRAAMTPFLPLVVVIAGFQVIEDFETSA